jgi:hypothetical protein
LAKPIEWAVKTPHMSRSEGSETWRRLHVDFFLEVALKKGLVNVHGMDVEVESSGEMKHKARCCLAGSRCPCVHEVHPGLLGEAFGHEA